MNPKVKMCDSNYATRLITELIKLSCIKNEQLSINDGQTIPWHDLYHVATEQGVTAIVWDAIVRLIEAGELSKEQLPERALKLQWALRAENIKNRYNKQRQLAESLAKVFADNDIETNVLKGFAISLYYPVPEYRECGDLDCLLTLSPEGADRHPEGAYKTGNSIAEGIGAEVEYDYYKHSHISYKGLTVENHAFCTAIRGGKERKAFERHLQSLIATTPSTPINDTKLLQPCADFNALFLTAHGFGHFLSEGIKLRHILDWALLLKTEQEKINWGEFYRWTDKMQMTRFVDALTAISIQHLGLEITNHLIHTSSPFADAILHDTLCANNTIFNKGYSPWMSRLMLIKNKLSSGWKYHKIYRKSIILEITRSVFAFIFERDPKI